MQTLIPIILRYLCNFDDIHDALYIMYNVNYLTFKIRYMMQGMTLYLMQEMMLYLMVPLASIDAS